MPMIEDKIFFKKIFNINDEGDGEEKITLYYNVNQDGYERIKISKNYFFDYYEKTSDKFFSLVLSFFYSFIFTYHYHFGC